MLARRRRRAKSRRNGLQSSMEIAASLFVNSLKGVIEENLLDDSLSKKELAGVLGALAESHESPPDDVLW